MISNFQRCGIFGHTFQPRNSICPSCTVLRLTSFRMSYFTGLLADSELLPVAHLQSQAFLQRQLPHAHKPSTPLPKAHGRFFDLYGSVKKNVKKKTSETINSPRPQSAASPYLPPWKSWALWMLVAANGCPTKRSPTSQEGSAFQHRKDQPLPVTSEICGKCGPEICFNLLNLLDDTL